MALALIIGATSLLATPASADHLGDSAADPNDVGGRLDLRYVEAKPIAEGDRIQLKIRTDEGWGCRYLSGRSSSDPDRAHGSLRWEVDTNRDPYKEHTWFYSCNGEGEFFLSTEHHMYEAHKPNPRTIVVSLPSSTGGLDKEGVELTPISRSDGVYHGEALFDEEDATRGLKPYAVR